MPLSILDAGDEGEIILIKGKEEQKRFIANLGFVLGEKVKVISQNKGDVIVTVKGTRVALGASLANKITVRV